MNIICMIVLVMTMLLLRFGWSGPGGIGRAVRVVERHGTLCVVERIAGHLFVRCEIVGFQFFVGQADVHELVGIYFMVSHVPE